MRQGGLATTNRLHKCPSSKSCGSVSGEPPPVYILNSYRSQKDRKLDQSVWPNKQLIRRSSKCEDAFHMRGLMHSGESKPRNIPAKVLATIRKFECRGWPESPEVPTRRMGLFHEGLFSLRKSVARCHQCWGCCHLYILSRCSSCQGSAGKVHGVFLTAQQAGRISLASLVASFLDSLPSRSIRQFFKLIRQPSANGTPSIRQCHRLCIICLQVPAYK